ncbi:MAG: DUF2141 domain-containing protein [Deltaproteobacteria bacterium]|jgi:uncharacterized protein (DUF2141 family)|nr:DUF2141 domain-containing protein [Deltaproteobacteria bacterium]
MKTITLSALITFLTIFNLSAGEKNRGSLTLRYNNLASNKGVVVVKLYDSTSSKFPDTKSAIAIKTANIDQYTATITFDELPYDKYAFTTFHDENINGKMDENIFRFPTEGCGFSNNLKITFALPSFDEASFVLDKDTLDIEVKMYY